MFCNENGFDFLCRVVMQCQTCKYIARETEIVLYSHYDNNILFRKIEAIIVKTDNKDSSYNKNA